jgi:hypothetical protein
MLRAIHVTLSITTIKILNYASLAPKSISIARIVEITLPARGANQDIIYQLRLAYLALK